MQGNQEETESQQPRVSHPSEAGRRTKEPGGKQKVNNKESVTLEGESRNPNNKDSVTPESYLSIHPSIHPSIYLLRNPWEHGKTERQQQRVPQETLTQPFKKTKQH